MRRRAGIGAIRNNREQQDLFKQKATQIQENELDEMMRQMTQFKTNLEDYAAKHKQEIVKDPAFRRQFQEMCASIGVDPLASSKGFWSEMLGVGDLYYEISVQVVEMCVAGSALHGGFITLQDCLARLNCRRGRASCPISRDDVLRAVKKLSVLGSGVELVKIGGTEYISAIPGELTTDHNTVLECVDDRGRLTCLGASDRLGWAEERCQRSLDQLAAAGLLWVDDVDASYWLASVFRQK